MNFNFKMGKIVTPRSFAGKGNIFQVRIVPDMDEIEETDLLPYFPNFFKENDIAYQAGNPVWCLTNDDFTVGFVLGHAQGPAGDSITSFIQLINLAENEAGMPLSGYNDLSVIRFSGTSIQYVNVATGATGQLFNNKAVFLTGTDGRIWVKNSGFKMSISANGDMQVEGKLKKEVLASSNTTVKGKSEEEVGSKSIRTSGGPIVLSGSDTTIVAGGTMSSMSGGDRIETTTAKKKETVGMGVERTILTGGTSETIIAGNFTLNIVAGVASINVGAGALSIFAGLGVNISSTTAVNISAPIINLPKSVATSGIPSLAGFCQLPVCVVTGVPHSTSALTSLGV